MAVLGVCVRERARVWALWRVGACAQARLSSACSRVWAHECGCADAYARRTRACARGRRYVCVNARARSLARCWQAANNGRRLRS
eukprot:850164-Pleurochrysis_carterae.AAC.1